MTKVSRAIFLSTLAIMVVGATLANSSQAWSKTDFRFLRGKHPFLVRIHERGYEMGEQLGCLDMGLDDGPAAFERTSYFALSTDQPTVVAIAEKELRSSTRVRCLYLGIDSLSLMDGTVVDIFPPDFAGHLPLATKSGCTYVKVIAKRQASSAESCYRWLRNRAPGFRRTWSDFD